MACWILQNPIVVKVTVADGIFTVMTEPVIQAIAKPRTIMNHVQSRLPEIDALGSSTSTKLIRMPIHNIVKNLSMINSYNPKQQNENNQAPNQQELATSDRENHHKKRC